MFGRNRAGEVGNIPAGIDGLLTAGTVFDWISPALSIAQDLAHDGGFTFLVDQACGYSGGDLVGLLHSFGIATWGHMIINDTIMFTVDPSNGPRAAAILERAGIVAQYPAIEETAAAVPSAWFQLSPFG